MTKQQVKKEVLPSPIQLDKTSTKQCIYYTIFGTDIQGYLKNYSEFSEKLRPLSCPFCGRMHPLRKHGTYSRNICDLHLAPVMIAILRYYCPACGLTVSILPSFCLPRKQYSAGVISLCLQLVLSCEVSLRRISIAYPLVNRILAGVWLKQWSLSSPNIVSVLRDDFNFKARSISICVGHISRYITPTSLESFFVSCDFVLSNDLASCHGRCDISESVICSHRSCSIILKSLQERFSVLPFSVRLF